MTNDLGHDREDLGELLRDLRELLGLTEHGMAELMYTSQQTYRSWESGTAKLRQSSRQKINTFVDSALAQLTTLKRDGVNVSDMLPLNLAASTLGVPHELLFHAYRDHLFEADDLGILGVWVDRADLDMILAAVTE